MAESAMPMQCVRVVKSATCGRGLVFTSNFARGQCILEELPHVYTLKNLNKGYYCDFCLKKCTTLKKCSRCNYVSYCNKSCQKGDWVRCHKQDCKALKRIHPRVPSDLVQLLSQIIRKQRKSDPCTQDDEDCFPTTVDQLESHHEKLMRLNELVSTFSVVKDWIGEDVLPEPSSLLKMKGAILCNRFAITDNFSMIVIASGLYMRASMVNHSCDPNCEQVFDGLTLQIRTVKAVKEGEECTISYVLPFNTAKERQAGLEETYHFICKCVKCVEEIDPDDGLGELELRDLKKSWEQIQDAEKSQDPAKVLQLCEPYLKQMDPSSSLPANHYLLMQVRYQALITYSYLEAWEEAAEIGKLNTEPMRYHCGPYSVCLGVYLFRMGNVLLHLGRLQEANKYLKEAESVLVVTHGPHHSLMAVVKELLCYCRLALFDLSVTADNISH